MKNGGSAILDFLGRENFSDSSPAEQRTLLENVINLILRGEPPGEDALGLYTEMLREVEKFSTKGMKAVVFGGGNGLSSILGGDNTKEAWGESPYSGLKMLFEDLTVVVCVTDDGGSTGELIRRVPVIAVGDIRRAVLSAVTPRNLQRAYRGITAERVEELPGLLQKIVNHRFGERAGLPARSLKTVLSLVPAARRALVPEELSSRLESAWQLFKKHPVLSRVPVRSHCLGNLLLTAEIYRRVPPGSDETEPPGHRAVVDGIHHFAHMMGSGWKTVYPVSTRQGELRFLYTNGVVVTGEFKSSVSRRGFPVDHVRADYIGGPRIAPRLIKSVAEADIIVIAPGSIYSSLIPILQVPEIADAVRRNRKAIKILGANFWVQKGETDISIRDLGKAFAVSDLIEAYNKNIEGGTGGLFRQVVSNNLKNLPAEVIQNYALEGKIPIYMDRDRVEDLGFEPLAVEIHSSERLERGKVFQHDPAKFAGTVKTLITLKKLLGRGWTGRSATPRARKRARSPGRKLLDGRPPRALLLSEYMTEVERLFDGMTIASPKLRRILPEVVWRNRDIRIEHLSFLKGIRVVPRKRWVRSTAWDRILAYYDPADSFINLRRDLLDGASEPAAPGRLHEDLLIGLGESLLGNYAASKSLRPLRQSGRTLGKVFEITLRPEEELSAFLTRAKITEYLELAQLQTSEQRPDVYSLVINDNDSFTPPGLLFGLLYAWYLDNRYGCMIDFEMSLLKIGTSDLIPKPNMDRERFRNLIDFFRNEVF